MKSVLEMLEAINDIGATLYFGGAIGQSRRLGEACKWYNAARFQEFLKGVGAQHRNLVIVDNRQNSPQNCKGLVK